MIFFSLPESYPSAGIFGPWHLLLLTVTFALVALGLRLSCRLGDGGVRRVLRISTALLWALEAIKILFVLLVVRSRNPNDFVPLYFCSLTLYAGAFSSLGRGWVRRTGDCFLATGGVVGGALFLFFPTTSLPRYPALHFISLHSFLLHGLMVYLGLLLLIRGVFRPRFSDLRYYFVLVSLTCAIACFFNWSYDRYADAPLANLMFMSKDFPGTPITLIYHLCGAFFPWFMWLVQSLCPFLIVYLAQQPSGPHRRSRR